MTLRPSTAPQRVPLLSPPASSLPDGPDSESDSLRAAIPTVTCFLATTVTDPLFESTAASALVAELVDFAAACRLDYATSLVAESAFVSVCPPFVRGECALGTDVLEDRQEGFECFAASVPHLMSMLLAPEGDPDAPDIPTPRSYAEAIEGPYSSQWQAAMEAEMASWKSTGTYVDKVPPPWANIVSGMWIFRVKRPPGSPPAFKAHYVERGFSQRQGVDFFQTFSPTPKMTTLCVRYILQRHAEGVFRGQLGPLGEEFYGPGQRFHLFFLESLRLGVERLHFSSAKAHGFPGVFRDMGGRSVLAHHSEDVVKRLDGGGHRVGVGCSPGLPTSSVPVPLRSGAAGAGGGAENLGIDIDGERLAYLGYADDTMLALQGK
ncbi:unnamed protein product [Closterium sp. NIES-53]